MTTVDPDTLERDREVLRDIIRLFDGRLALNADITRPGTFHVGDEVRLVKSTATPTIDRERKPSTVDWSPADPVHANEGAAANPAAPSQASDLNLDPPMCGV